MGRGEPVELGHHQGVPSADGGQGLVHAGPGAPGAGEPLVEVDPVPGHAKAGEDLVLGGEVLQDGRALGVADQFSHSGSVPFRPPLPDMFADYLYETALPQADRLGGRGLRVSLGDPLTDTGSRALAWQSNGGRSCNPIVTAPR